MIFKTFFRLTAVMIVLAGGAAFAAEEPIAEDAGGDGGLMDQSVPVAEEDAAAEAAAQAGPPRLRKAYLREELLDEFGNYKRLMSEGIYDEARQTRSNALDPTDRAQVLRDSEGAYEPRNRAASQQAIRRRPTKLRIRDRHY
jgi:hypothetical protein